MKISKLDAAKRQLDTAINLFFKESDPVSIHTLTASAHQLLVDIGKLNGIKSFIKENPFIKEEFRQQFIDIVNEAQNFFKHADRDPNNLLDFNPEQTEHLLFDAVEMYMQLTNEEPEDLSIFRMWYKIKHPNIISDDIKEQLGNALNKYSAMNRTTFFSTMKNACIHSGISNSHHLGDTH